MTDANHHGKPPPEPGDPNWCPSEAAMMRVPDECAFPDDGPDDDAFVRELLAHMAKPIDPERVRSREGFGCVFVVGQAEGS